MVDTVGLFIIVALLALFVFLFTRALRARRGVLKALGAVLFGLLSLAALAALVLAGIGTYKLSVPRYTYGPVSDVKVNVSPEHLEKGKRYAALCADCHSSQGGGSSVLDGGENFMAGPGAPPIGAVHPTNLTPAGELKDWSDGDIIRAIREGVHKSGRPLIIMPAMAFHAMSDEDVQAVVAYLRSQDPVENSLPPTKINVLGAIMLGAGLFPPEIIAAQEPITGAVSTPQTGTAERGEYLTTIMGCRDCHGVDLSGNGPNGAGPNLTALLPQWSEEQFVSTIRTGVDPSGHELNPELMPWKAYGQVLLDDELKDMYTYLHGLTPIVKGAGE